MLIDKISIPLQRWQIDEILEKRVEQQHHKIEDLFLVWSSNAAFPDPGFYDTKVLTKYGELRVFFTPDCPPNKSYVLHKAKFDYPKKNNQTSFDKNGDLVH